MNEHRASEQRELENAKWIEAKKLWMVEKRRIATGVQHTHTRTQHQRLLALAQITHTTCIRLHTIQMQ